MQQSAAGAAIKLSSNKKSFGEMRQGSPLSLMMIAAIPEKDLPALGFPFAGHHSRQNDLGPAKMTGPKRVRS